MLLIGWCLCWRGDLQLRCKGSTLLTLLSGHPALQIVQQPPRLRQMEGALGAPSFGEEHLLAVYRLPSLSTLWPGGGIPWPSLGSLQWPFKGSQCPRAPWCWSGSSKRAETWRKDFSHRSLSKTKGNTMRCAIWPVCEVSSAFTQNQTFFDFVYPRFPALWLPVLF